MERLYLVEKLSAAKIARLYGLKHPNPKSSETLVLYHLRMFGIARRDAAAHMRKVTEPIIDEWVKRYTAGESLKQVAGSEFSPVTVWNHLKGRGLQLRNKIEAQILAVSIHDKRPFDGKENDSAYLIGFAAGDLSTTKHGRAIRVRTSTTHPAMAELFDGLFGRFDPIYTYPKRAPWTNFEWSFDADLDSSFAFLFGSALSYLERLEGNLEQFLSFLSGFFDAEGSIYLHEKANGFAPEIAVTNKNRELLEILAAGMMNCGVVSKLEHREQDPARLGGSTLGDIWVLRVWRLGDVQRLLHGLRLRHRERVDKARIALQFESPISLPSDRPLVNQWFELREQIDVQRVAFIDQAKLAFQTRLQRRANTST